MATVELNEKNFRETVDKEGIVLVDWWATWCAPCRAFAPIFDAASARDTDVVFGKVNTEQERLLAASFRIQAIPTLMAFRDGILVFEQAGALPAAAVAELVRQVRALDMAEVRREVEAAKKASSGA